MRTPKLLALVSAAAVIGGGSLQAQSPVSEPPASMSQGTVTRLSPEQEDKVREELRRQIAILNAQDAAENPQKNSMSPVSANNPPSAPMAGLSPEDEQKVRDALHKAEAESDAKSAVPPSRLSADDERKVRDALHQAEADMDAQNKAAADKAAAEMSAVVKTATAMSAPQPSPQDKAAADKAAADQAAAALAAQQKAAADQAAAAVAAQRQALAKQENLSSEGLYTPPSAIMVPGSKEQRLFDLLQLYKADKISPTEYHEQRAKIVAEP